MCKYGLNKADVVGTFSMVARCPKTSALGVCVSTAIPAVGSVVPHAEEGVGAIATQGYTNILYGIEGLKLMRKGFPPKTALETMLSKDPDRELRQVIIINNIGDKAAFTGRVCSTWKGHIFGKGYVAAGNLLTSGKVLEAMGEAFERSEGWLAGRLMRALDAGEAAGGDRRGRASAALLVVGCDRPMKSRPFLDLRVDLHEEPVEELRRIFESYKKWIGFCGGFH